MRKLQKNPDTVLIIKSEIHVLVMEKFPGTNFVCPKCSLYDSCWREEETPLYSDLCKPTLDDGRWYFVRSLFTPENKTRELVRQINDCVDI